MKYSLDRNLLGPAVRVGMGLIAGLLMLGAAEWLRPRASRAAYVLAGSLALGFLLLLLEVRHWFHLTAMDRGSSGNGEQLAYSIVCLLFGAALMIPGVMQRQKALRYASLGMLTLAVCKVFLFDASTLEGLYRVGSFFGLCVSLIGLGIVYQRFVARSLPA